MVIGLSLLSFGFGNVINKNPHKSWIHTLGVVVILGVLIAFKYLGFLTSIYNSMAGFISALPRFEIQSLLLPLGISYIIFKHISYLTDIKWGLVKPGRFTDFLLYSSLFTIFVAGPIERFERLKPQLEPHRIPFSWDNIDHGVMRIIFGLFKKLVLADWIGHYINPFWQNPSDYSNWTWLIALVGYAFQIYFDFAGYSDVAIGSSKLFGIQIMENFDNPYLAVNLGQFWRRWHISLSDWIRDYLFFPLSKLGNNRFWLVICVPVIAMSTCGLWHGSAVNFIIWGVWHGIGLSCFQIWNLGKKKHKKLSRISRQKWFLPISVITTSVYVIIGWIFFVSYDLVSFPSIFLSQGERSLQKIGLLFIGFGFIGVFVVPTFLRIATKRLSPKSKNWVSIMVIMMAIQLLMSFRMASTTFIYAGF